MFRQTFPVGPLQCNCTLLGDTQTGKVLQSIPLPRRFVRTLAFTTDGNRIFVGSHEGRLSLFDIETGHETKSFMGH